MQIWFGVNQFYDRLKPKENSIAYLPSVEKVPSFVKAYDEIKPTTEIAVDRYMAYKRSGCEEVRR